jgi:AmiR/NasT family two-component response regulator
VSYPLTAVGHAATSLNLYTDLDGTKDHIDRQTGEVAVPLLAMVLTAVNQRHRLHHLAIGLATSRSIGAAIGVLMSRHHWTYDQAFEALRTASHDHHRRLRDIAADVVMTGDLPK